MSKREAERLEDALEHVSRGEAIDSQLASLLHTAQQATVLAETPPAPPRGLAPGRQRFLAAAAERRAEKAGQGRQRVPVARVAKLAAVFAAALLLFGLLFSAGRAMADSLPGEPFYGLRLAAERVRLALTGDLQARADLHLALAVERLDEIAALLGQGQTLDGPVASRAKQQLTTALEAAVGLADPTAVQELQRLSAAIQQRERTILQLVDLAAEPPLRELLREMERVREEAQAGQGDPDGLRHRLRQGVPAELTDLPGPSRTPQPSYTAGPRSISTPHPTQTARHTPLPSVTPQPTHTPHHTAQPSVTSQPTHTPRRTAQPGMTPQPTHTPLHTAQPSVTPNQTGMPNQTSTPDATGGPANTPGPATTPGPASTPGPANTPGPGDDPGHGGP